MGLQRTNDTLYSRVAIGHGDSMESIWWCNKNGDGVLGTMSFSSFLPSQQNDKLICAIQENLLYFLLFQSYSHLKVGTMQLHTIGSEISVSIIDAVNAELPIMIKILGRRRRRQIHATTHQPNNSSGWMVTTQKDGKNRYADMGITCKLPHLDTDF